MNKTSGSNTSTLQLERLVFFSDALFAIAITLLIMDIKTPFQEHFSNQDLLKALRNILPELFGFVISFFVIAAFWVHHRTVFSYVAKFDPKLMWINIFFLFFIVLLPFSTDVFAIYGHLEVATSLYTLNILCAGIMNFLCMRYVVKSKQGISKGLGNKKDIRLIYATILAIPSWMGICWVIGLLTQPGIGDLFLFGLAFVMPLTQKLFS